MINNLNITTEFFEEKCTLLQMNNVPITIDNLAVELQVKPYIVFRLIKNDPEFRDIFLYYTNYKNFEQLFDIVNNPEFLKNYPSHSKNLIYRSRYSDMFGYINDAQIKKNIEINNNSVNSNANLAPFIPKMNAIYYDLLNVTARYVILFGGAGSGKSYAVATWMLYKIFNSQFPIRILYGRKFFAHIKQSQFALFKSLITQYNLDDYFIINKSDYRITCKHNNSELIAIGMDDPEKIKSIFDPVAIWIEEATELNKDDFEQLDLRLRTTTDNLQIVFSFNPISKKHWLRQTFTENIEIELGKPITNNVNVSLNNQNVTLQTYILRTNYTHNKHLPAQYIAALEKLKVNNPNYYDIYVNAEWGDAGEGWLFKREFYDEYSELPTDARGVIYCDPNLSKKMQGDTTAMVKLLFSPSTQLYYVDDVICRKYSDANNLLQDLFSLYHSDGKIFGLAFDGNVNQESQWTQHVRNFSQLYNTPIPVIDYKNYRVDDLAKNASMLWNEGRIKFRVGINKTNDGEEFLSQVYSFIGKKVNNKNHDDAPDALICAVQALFERGYHTTNFSTENKIIKNLI